MDWGAKCQASVQAATCGAELDTLKLEVEDAVRIRCYLRAMGVKVNSPTTVCYDNKVVVTSTTAAGSNLSKNILF